MSTFSNTANFSNISGATVADGSVSIADYPVTILHMDGTDESQTIVDSAGQHTFAVDGAPALDTDVKQFGTAALHVPQSGTVKSTDNVSDFQFGANDFKIECWLRQNVAGGYQYVACKHGGVSGAVWSDGGYEWLIWHNNVLAFQWKTATSNAQISSGSVTLTGSMHHLIVECVSGTLTMYLDDTVIASGTVSEIAEVNTGTPAFYVGSTDQGNYAFNGWIDEVRVWSGSAPDSPGDEALIPDCEFLIHDSGAVVCDAGYGKTFDNSEATVTTTASPTVNYYVADYITDQGWTTAAEVEAGAAWVGPYTLAELQALENSLLRYRYFKAEMTGVYAASFDEFSCDTANSDVTPPAVPTLAKFSLFESDNYALIWTEPTDSDFSHCELKRVIDGVAEYLGKADSLPVWQESPAAFWSFSDDNASADSVFSSFTDEDVSGSAVAYYIRSVDLLENKSVFASFTAGSTGSDLPATPSLAVADDADGDSVTVALSGSDSGAVNKIYVKAANSGDWVLATLATGGDAEVVGDGEFMVAVTPGQYWMKVESAGAGGTVTGGPVLFWATDGNCRSGEIREYLCARMAGSSSLAALLGGSGNIFFRNPPQSMVYPAVIYEFGLKSVDGLDSPGGFGGELLLHIYASCGAQLDSVVDELSRLFDGHVFDTPGWVCRRVVREGEAGGSEGVRSVDGRTVLRRTVGYSLRIFRKGA